MAIYHFTAKAISFGKGESAVHRAAYHARTQLRDERNSKDTRDYAHKGDLAWSGIFAPKDAPTWTRDRAQLWNRAEAAERQANGQPARNLEMALPNELTREQQVRLLTDFLREQCARKGMIADANIHSDYDAEGIIRAGADPTEPRNDHVHVLLTMRRLDGDRFSKTKTDAREWNSKEQLATWRENWAKAGAKALQKAGFEIEAQRFAVGHLTLPEQRKAALDRGDIAWADQLDREPDIKQGAASAGMEKRGERSDRAAERRDVFNRNAEREEVRAEAEIIDLELARLDREQRTGTTGRGRGRAARQEADRIKAANEARYRDMRARHEAAYQRRQQEIVQSRAEREAGRHAIYEKYRTALDAIWKPEPGPKAASPEMEAWRQFGRFMDQRKAQFEQRDRTLLGRLDNAARLLATAPRRRNQPRGLFAIVRLAFNHEERRKLFEREQRRTFARLAPPKPARPKERPKPVTPEPRRVQAERLKAMRTAELADYAKRQAAAAKSMQARHQFQREAEAAEKAAFERDRAAAWAAHREAFPQEQARTGRREATTGQEIDAGSPANDTGPDPGAENLTGEADEAFRDYSTSPEPSGATLRPDMGESDPIAEEGRAEGSRALTPDQERQARINARRAAREGRDTAERSDRTGRERGR